MPLEFQTVQLPFTGGVDAKTDPKHVPAAKLLTLENGVFTTPGVIKKRYGHKTLSSTLTSAQDMAAYNDELLVANRDGLYSLRDATDTMAKVGSPSACDLTFKQLEATGGAGYVAFDSATSVVGTTCYVYRDPVTVGAATGKLYFSMLDNTTGTFIHKHVAVASSVTFEYSPRVIAVGSYYVIFGEVDTNTEVKAYSILADGSSATVTDRSATLGTASLARGWDVVATGGEGVFLYPPTGGTYLTAACFTSTLSVTNYSQNLGAGIVGVYGACAYTPVSAPTQVGAAVLYYSAGEGGAKLRSVSRTGGWGYGPHASPVAPGNWGTGLVAAGDTVHIWSTVTNGSAREYVAQSSIDMSTGTAAAVTTVAANCRLASRPFIPVSAPCAWVCTASSDQPQYLLYDSSSVIHGRAMYKFAYPGTSAVGATGFRIPEVRATATGYAVPLTGYFLSTTPDGKTDVATPQPWSTVLASCSVGAVDTYADFSGTAVRGQSVASSKALFLTGGVLKSYDGASCTEAGFLTFPEDFTWSSSSAGATYTYQYVATYEWTDASGQTYVSGGCYVPFAVTSAAVIGTATITVNVQACLYTAKENVRVVLYRTLEAVSPGAGAVYYRVAEGSASTAGYDGYFRVSLTDAVTDAVAQTKGQAYFFTTPAAEREAPGATKAIASYRGRVFAVSAEHPTFLRLSTEAGSVEYPISVPAEFSDGGGFTVSVDPDGGPITALGVVDANLIIFKESKMFGLTGTGPGEDGTGTDLLPVAIAAEVGCPYPKSVVQTPNGLMFQSHKGIYLLDRSLSITYVGAPIETELGTATVRSAMLVPKAYQVRFALSSGKWLVWDYVMNQWSTFTGLTAAGMGTWGDEACYVSTAGVVYQEDRTVYTDAGSFVQLHVVTAWLQLAGLQGFQRVNRAILLAEGSPSHTISVRLYTDFRTSSDQLVTLAPSTDTPVMQRRIHLKNQKCEAVKLDITDVSVTGTDGGLSLSGLAFEIGTKRGVDKLGPSRST